MRFRLRAFAIHLSVSAGVLTLLLGSLYLGWYYWPGWYLTEVEKVVGIVLLVDVAIGPTLTLVVANPLKARRLLARDLTIIGMVQLVALAYGAITLWQGRPLYYSFSADRLEITQASDIRPAESALARKENPTLAPHWYSRVRWVYAPLPEDPKDAEKIVNSTLFGGQDVVDMPRYFKPWLQGLPQLRTRLAAVQDATAGQLSRAEKQSLSAKMRARGLSAEAHNALILWADVRKVIVIFDPQTLRIVAILKPR